MTVTTVRPSSTQADGHILSASATYATARDAYTAGSVSSTSTTSVFGDHLNASTHNLYQGCARFDLSGIGAEQVVSAAVFEYTTSFVAITTNAAVEMLGFDAGTLVQSADYRSGAQAAALTNYGSIPAVTNNTSTTTYQVSLNAAGIAAVQAALAGNFGMVLIGANFIANVAPTGDNRYTIRTSEDATPARRPALIVTHRLVYEDSVSETVGIADAVGGGGLTILTGTLRVRPALTGKTNIGD